jgi:hypothetical protein
MTMDVEDLDWNMAVADEKDWLERTADVEGLDPTLKDRRRSACEEESSRSEVGPRLDQIH